jgi:hypothetical protein
MTTAIETPTKGKMQIKVYLVCIRNNVAKAGEPNTKILAARLTREAAQRIVDLTPGSYIEKQVAVK